MRWGKQLLLKHFVTYLGVSSRAHALACELWLMSMHNIWQVFSINVWYNLWVTGQLSCTTSYGYQPMCEHIFVFFLFFSQSLINLFISSRAISNVWDNDKDVSGLSEYICFDFYFKTLSINGRNIKKLLV